ncbi:tumor necrosis factor alpha-induced protein 2-like [Pempheris klunzingeri]|uniref:tumor necrosis factor alpha-induced protein 2-like n=1 Tax=Pempheris klunzingeri TaxID=3127111 RepID=UPI003980D62D
MCLRLRYCFPCRSCRAEGLLTHFSSGWSRCSACWSRFRAWIRMRTRFNAMESDGFRLNIRLPRLWGGHRGQAPPPAVITTSATDGHHSPQEEVSRPVKLTFEQVLEAQQLCEASRLLIEREERLFGEIMEEEALKRHQEEVDKLAADRRALEGLVLQTVTLSLIPEEVDTNALASAVRAISLEVDQDRQWKHRDRTQPAWRPCGWKELHDSTLCRLVKERISNPSTTLASQVDQSSLQVDVNSMGKQLKMDLLWVVEVVKSCYPPELDICNFYARLYHQSFSARVRKISNFGLDDKDCTFLLRWVNEYYSGILQKPELAGDIDSEALGKLLPKELLDPMEEQYLTKQQEELTTYVGRVLEEAKQKWNKGEEPTTEDGCFVSPVAYDIIQLINGMVTSAEKVVGDRQKAQSITCQLNSLMQRFKIFQNDVIKQNKPNSRPLVKANLGCIEQFRDVLEKKSHLFPQDVQENCLHVLTHMEQSAHMYLLKPVHEVLKPQYRKLGTSDWLNKSLFEELLVSITQELQDLQGSIESCNQKLIGQLHQEVTAEYVKRLLRGDKLKGREQQLKAYTTVKDNAESLHELFSKKGSKEDWLKEILTKIAEVLKLQDLPAIQMQVVSLGTDFPDLSERHVSALLKLKTNLSRADRRTVKDTLSDTLKENGLVVTRPFFSTVQIK